MMLRWLVLLYSLGVTEARLTGETEIDVDEGQDWDIFDINEGAGLDLLEGDIDQDETTDRNTILGEKYRWPKTIPYYLEESLEMNAKGVILKAFDQYRLKTCIDFTPWRGEANYISVYKGSGCSSALGNQRVGKQRLSIGNNCDRLGTVEHEFLHALGLWHEQSRADRDDYVNIMWEPGKEHNFKTRDDSESSALGIPYDYGLVMHYSKTSFNIGSKSTIIPNIPQFNDVIGQRMDFSANDLAKLSLLYNCTKSSSFVESCNFEEENLCGMIGSPGEAKWEQRSSVSGGPHSDFTNMGQFKGKGFFMHFSSPSARPGDRALLETRWLYPNPGPLCLHFFLHNTAAVDDVLNIWVREYDKANPSGKRRLYKSIPGGGMDSSWGLYTINLEVTHKSRVVFEGIRGNRPSNGGFSLDDINVVSTTCPQHIWHIRNMTQELANTKPGTKIYSPRFLSPAGYSFQVGVYLNGRSDRPEYVGIYVHLTSGPNDHRLQWPCAWQQVTTILMDQQSDIRQQMNNHQMVTTDPEKVSDGELYWDNPSKVGSKVTASDGTTYYRGPGYGTSSFLTHSRLKSRNFIKGDDSYFLFSMEDISELLNPQPVPESTVSNLKAKDQTNPQTGTKSPLVITAVAASVAGVMLMVAIVTGGNAWRIKRRREHQENGEGATQDIPAFIEDHLNKDLPTLTDL